MRFLPIALAVLSARFVSPIASAQEISSPPILPPAEIASADPLDLLAIFASDDQALGIHTIGYILSDHHLPLADRVQHLADATFGPGRLAVQSIETSGSLRIARIDMIEDPSVTEFNQAWWYNRFQGTTGSIQTKRTIGMTFAQNAYDGEWIDRASLTSQFWLGSHAEDFSDGYSAGAFRIGWRWPEHLLPAATTPDSGVSVPTRFVLSAPRGKANLTSPTTLALWRYPDERFVCTLETLNPTSNQLSSVLLDPLSQSFTDSLSIQMPYLGNEPEFYDRLRDGHALRLHIYATNCALPDLYPPNQQGRTIIRPKDFSFRELTTRPIEVTLPSATTP